MIDKEEMCCLRDLYRAIAQVESQLEELYGLNFNEAMLLCHLKNEHDMTVGAIAQILAISQPNASKVIGSLEKKHLLRRRVDKKDKRVVHYQLSDRGEEKMESVDCERLQLPPALEEIVRLFAAKEHAASTRPLSE